jgi:hypothetical protein
MLRHSTQTLDAADTATPSPFHQLAHPLDGQMLARRRSSTRTPRARRLTLNARMIHDTLQDDILVQQIHVEMLKYGNHIGTWAVALIRRYVNVSVLCRKEREASRPRTGEAADGFLGQCRCIRSL